MRTILLLIISSCSLAYSQTQQNAALDKPFSLDVQYQKMKEGSQTFKDYKVIKETQLDKFWNITGDSIKMQEQRLAEAKAEISKLKEELKSTQNAMQVQQASVADVVFDSTHITVLGIPFTKGFFIVMMLGVIGALTFGLSVCMAKVKFANGLVKEKTLIADSVSHEFEDFKKKAMDKQTKLSRELQNERNKWMEARKS